MCGEEKVQLHHTTYDRVGDEELTDLMPLCFKCHTMIHALERRGEIGLDFQGFEDAQRAFLYAQKQAPVRAKAKREFKEAHGYRQPEWRQEIERVLRRLEECDQDLERYGTRIRKVMNIIEGRMRRDGRTL